MHLRKLNPTLLKYFFSYFFVVVILFGCFFFIFKKNFTTTYYNNAQTSCQKLLSSIQTTLNSEVNAFILLDNQIKSDIDVTMSSYTYSSYHLYQASEKLHAYDIANNIIDSISIISNDGTVLLSTAIPIVLFDDGYYLCHGGVNYPLPLEDYLSTENQFFRLETGNKSFLLYIASHNPKATCYTVYILNLNELTNLLSPGSNNGITSLCLLDANQSFLAGYAPQHLFSFTNALPASSDLYDVTNNDSIYTVTDVAGSCSLAAVISNQAILGQANSAMCRSLIAFALLFLVSLFIIMLAMQFTFRPLHKLTGKLVSTNSRRQNYFDLLEDTFHKITAEKNDFQKKLNNYRQFIQKSLLDSVIQSSSTDKLHIYQLDALFSMGDDGHIYIAKVMNLCNNSDFPDNARQFIYDNLQTFPLNSVAIMEHTEQFALFLISYANHDKNGDAIIGNILMNLYRKFGFQCIVSNKATSPLEIPSLYENVETAVQHGLSSPVLFYNETMSQNVESSHLLYPTSQLEELTNELRNRHFTSARVYVTDLIHLLDGTAEKASAEQFTNFFVRSVLIDILTILTNAISEYNVKFENYNDLYFSTLYLCRSCPYKENSHVLLQNMLALLNFCEENSANVSVSSSQINKIMNEEYTSPDFSITTLADAFHISTSHMSELFKINFGENFSNYLWNMRLEKAKILLSNTNQTIEQISISVGYLNVSSFRRKFKQQVGITPAQYREQHCSIKK